MDNDIRTFESFFNIFVEIIIPYIGKLLRAMDETNQVKESKQEVFFLTNIKGSIKSKWRGLLTLFVVAACFVTIILILLHKKSLANVGEYKKLFCL